MFALCNAFFYTSEQEIYCGKQPFAISNSSTKIVEQLIASIENRAENQHSIIVEYSLTKKLITIDAVKKPQNINSGQTKTDL